MRMLTAFQKRKSFWCLPCSSDYFTCMLLCLGHVRLKCTWIILFHCCSRKESQRLTPVKWRFCIESGINCRKLVFVPFSVRGLENFICRTIFFCPPPIPCSLTLVPRDEILLCKDLGDCLGVEQRTRGPAIC